MGSPDFAVPSLLATERVCDLVLVVTQPDRPAGRGRKLQSPPVKLAAQALRDGAGVEVIQPRKVRDGELRDRLATLDLDVIVVTAYGRILPEDILGVPRLGCINVHGSLLPRWRGAAPIQRAVLAGDTKTGISIMKMDAGCDTGPVFETVETPIGAEETSGELFDRLSTLGGAALEAFLKRLPDGAMPEAQPTDGVKHAPKLEKAEGIVDWTRPDRELVDHVRGMDPWPGAVTTFEGAPLKLFGARLVAGAEPINEGAQERKNGPDAASPGQIVAIDDLGLHIAAGEGRVCITHVQPAGKKRMSAAAFATGRHLEPGRMLGS